MTDNQQAKRNLYSEACLRDHCPTTRFHVARIRPDLGSAYPLLARYAIWEDHTPAL